MVMMVINGKEYYFDQYLVDNLDGMRKYVEKKWDGILIIGGYEGDGKSWLASQIAYYLDPTYNIDRCVFTASQFREAVLSAEPFQAIVFDEAQSVFESTNKTREAMITKDMLTRIRRRRLFIIICAPDFWRLSRYIFIHRSRAFIRVYETETVRGKFAFYNREAKHELYIKGRREENINIVKPNFRGRSAAWFPLDEEAYDDKKEAAERADVVKGREALDLQKNILLDEHLTQVDKARLLGVSDRTVRSRISVLTGRARKGGTVSYNLQGGDENSDD